MYCITVQFTLVFFTARHCTSLSCTCCNTVLYSPQNSWPACKGTILSRQHRLRACSVPSRRALCTECTVLYLASNTLEPGQKHSCCFMATIGDSWESMIRIYQPFWQCILEFMGLWNIPHASLQKEQNYLMIFSKNRPLGRFFHGVAMSGCVSLCCPLPLQFF